jgi:outer membrane protein TolC
MKIRLSVLRATFFVFLFIKTASAQEQVSLEKVIALALEKNYDIRLATNASEAYATDRGYAWAAFVPQVNATGSITRSNNNQELRFQDESRNNSGKAVSNITNGSVQLNWTLFDGTKMFATAERLRYIDAQGELLVKEQMVTTIASVITNYYDIVRQKQQLKATQEQMAVSEERVKLAERKLQVGTGGKPELLQARVDFNAQRTLTIQQEALIVQLKEQLNALVDSQLPPVYEVTDTIIINLDLKQEDLATNLERTNYSLQASSMNRDIAKLSLRERRAELYPVLSFNAAYNYSKTDNIKLIDPFSALYRQTDGYNYGLTLAVPILNGFNTKRLITQASINYSRQQLFYDQLKINVNVELKNAYVDYDNAKKILLIEEETILLAKENVFIALEGFKRGITTFIELRTAQQSLADAYNRLINARYLAKVAETQLLRLNGGLLK